MDKFPSARRLIGAGLLLVALSDCSGGNPNKVASAPLEAPTSLVGTTTSTTEQGNITPIKGLNAGDKITDKIRLLTPEPNQVQDLLLRRTNRDGAEDLAAITGEGYSKLTLNGNQIPNDPNIDGALLLTSHGNCVVTSDVLFNPSTNEVLGFGPPSILNHTLSFKFIGATGEAPEVVLVPIGDGSVRVVIDDVSGHALAEDLANHPVTVNVPVNQC